MDNEKRMAGDYEIIHAIHIGDKEVVVGENKADPDQRYLVAYCSRNEIMELFDDCLVSDTYPEIMKIFGERVSAQAELALKKYMTPLEQGIDITPITSDKVRHITRSDNIEGEIVVIDPECLRREYQVATHQLKLCVGGFGSHANSRGSACFCTDLYSGESSRFERSDIIGVISKEDLPDWAKQGLKSIQQAEKKKSEAR